MRATPGERVRRSDSTEESASDPRSGMTGGPLLSVAAGGGRRVGPGKQLGRRREGFGPEKEKEEGIWAAGKEKNESGLG